MGRVLIAMAERDSDPSEVAIPWKVLSVRGHAVSFATASGSPGVADEIMLTGEGLDVWGWVPGLSKLALAGRMLGANRDARDAYRAMENSMEYSRVRRFAEVDPDDVDALVLPGGHRARGIRPYLDDPDLHALVVAMFAAGKPVGAICHGTVVAARAIDPRTGKSVLFGRKTTSLTWAQERLAWRLGQVLRFWDGEYYRTYSEGPGDATGAKSVQAEVTAALENLRDYSDVPGDAPDHFRKTGGLHRDTMDDARPAWVVRDGNYVSARWPGDAHTFAKILADVIDERGS